jgi:hypothetical protein
MSNRTNCILFGKPPVFAPCRGEGLSAIPCESTPNRIVHRGGARASELHRAADRHRKANAYCNGRLTTERNSVLRLDGCCWFSMAWLACDDGRCIADEQGSRVATCECHCCRWPDWTYWGNLGPKQQNTWEVRRCIQNRTLGSCLAATQRNLFPMMIAAEHVVGEEMHPCIPRVGFLGWFSCCSGF